MDLWPDDTKPEPVNDAPHDIDPRVEASGGPADRGHAGVVVQALTRPRPRHFDAGVSQKAEQQCNIFNLVCFEAWLFDKVPELTGSCTSGNGGAVTPSGDGGRHALPSRTDGAEEPDHFGAVTDVGGEVLDLNVFTL